MLAAGVHDDGNPEGISEADFKESLKTLKAMSRGVNAALKGIKVHKGKKGKVAEVLIRREESR